jgi:hypothetical protein
MPEPISRERFAYLAERAGLDPEKIGTERFEELREGTAFLPRIQRTIRRRQNGKARERAVEPAHIFVHPKI